MATVAVTFQLTVTVSAEALPAPIEITLTRESGKASEGPRVTLGGRMQSTPGSGIETLARVLKKVDQEPLQAVYTALDAFEVACQAACE